MMYGFKILPTGMSNDTLMRGKSRVGDILACRPVLKLSDIAAALLIESEKQAYLQLRHTVRREAKRSQKTQKKEIRLFAWLSSVHATDGKQTWHSRDDIQNKAFSCF